MRANAAAWILLGLCACNPGPGETPGETSGTTTDTGGSSDALALTGVTLIDGTGAPAQSGMTILVDGGSIVAVTPDAEASIPAGATVEALEGRFVIPGLIDNHMHVFDKCPDASNSFGSTLQSIENRDI